MAELNDLQQRGFNVNPKLHQEITNAQGRIVEELKRVRFFQYMVVEFYENGAIKMIRKGTDWKVILTLGIAAVVIGSIIIYLIGPENIINFAKYLLERQKEIPAGTIEIIRNIVPGTA